MRKFVVILLLLPLHYCAPQSLQNAGSTGLQFLKIGAGARAQGMGGAFASIAGDISSLAVNPAGIGSLSKLGLSVQHTGWVAATELNFIGLVVPISDEVNLALQTTSLTTGSIEMTTIDQPDGTGERYDATDIAVGLTGSVRLTPQLTFATTIKYIQERIYDISSDGLALDAGMWYATGFKSLDLGFVISNLGFDQQFSGDALRVKYDPVDPSEPSSKAELQTAQFALPLSFRASGSFDVLEMFDNKIDGHRVTTALDFEQSADTPERVHLGMEYGWREMVFVRGGYIFNADELSWSGGIGALVELPGAVVQFDAAASSLGRFGVCYRFGIAITVN